MLKFLSLFNLGGNGASRSGDLKAARDLVARLPECNRGDIIALARKALRKYPDLAGKVAWLYAHERTREDDNGALALLAALLDEPEFDPAQRRRSAEAAAAELEKALRDKDIPDEVKITLLPPLLLAGRPVDENSVRGFFRDYEAAARRHSLKFAESVSDSPNSLTKLLLAKGFVFGEEDTLAAFVPVESASELLAIGRGVAEVNPAGATLMAAALTFRVGAPDFSHERSPGQLDGIHALATPRARWCLEILANWPGFAIPFRDKAARLAAELASRGIERRAPPAPGEFSHGIVSMIDGMGSRTATLFHRDPRGGLDALNLMLNDEVGVKDAFAIFGSAGGMEKLLRHNPDHMPVADATLPMIREILADSLALHEELWTAPPGRLFPLLAYLGDEPVPPRKREPDLGAYGLEAVRPTPKFMAEAVKLSDNPLFGCLFPASEAAYAFCEKHLDWKGRAFDLDKLSGFMKEIMPLERERLLRRLAINLEVEALAGRAGRKDNQTAARLWLGMREEVMPFASVPFIRELAGLAASQIAGDLRRGHRSQREAFEAEEAGTYGGAPDFKKPPKGKREAAPAGLARRFFGEAEPSGGPPPEFPAAAPGRAPKPRGRAKAGKKAAKRAWVYVGPPAAKSKPPNPKRAGPGRNRNIYRLAVELTDFPPPADGFMRANPGIVREIEIAGDQTLDKLHLAIFKAFDREETHAYEFQFSDKRMDPGAPRYGRPPVPAGDADAEPGLDAAAITLDELGLAVGQKFLYWFDFGDNWWHRLTVREVGPPVPRRKYPRLAASRGPSPPQYPEK
ncbi:MAG: plasmid pRiA4b ORF-3 family protein [Planctomycetota bacterium]|jgi:hypothetical protein|nr:plasmid pRiA4b ORF-3 family protein [Planctomycetota bacterium]